MKKFFFSLLLCFTATIFMHSLTERADASTVFENFQKAFPDTGILTEEELLAQTQFIENMDPYDDPFSSFIVFIPKNFQTRPEETLKNIRKNGKLVGDIAHYYSDVLTGDGGSINIEAHELKYNVTARNWLVAYLLDYGYSIEGIKEHTDDKAEALATVFDQEKGDYRDRIMVFKNGSRVILIKYSVNIYKWEAEKRLQAAVVKTFRPLKEDPSNLISLVDYDLMGFINVSYPESWKLAPGKSKDYDRPYFRVLNTRLIPPQSRMGKEELTYVGIIYFQLIMYHNLETDLISETENVKLKIDSMNFEIGDKLDTELRLAYPENATITSAEVYDLVNTSDNNEDFELWLASIKTDEFMYVVAMISPTKERDFKAWIENKSTFEQVVLSISPTVYDD